MGEYFYTQDHLWILKQHNKPMLLGVTEYLTIQGKPEYLQLPQPGEIFKPNQSIGCLETDKCTINISLPFSVKIVNINVVLCNEPKRLLDSSEKEKWLCEIELLDNDDLKSLMTDQQYRDYCAP